MTACILKTVLRTTRLFITWLQLNTTRMSAFIKNYAVAMIINFFILDVSEVETA